MNRKLLIIIPICCSFLLNFAGCRDVDDYDCVVGDETYPNGSGNVPSGDDCNICACIGGTVRCTNHDCDADDSCNVDGIVYPNGSDIPSGDDCNICMCRNGTVECSRLDCDPTDSCIVDGVTYPHGSMDIPSGDCNTCGCLDGIVECTPIDCSARRDYNLI